MLAPQLAILEAIRAELPEDGIFVDEVTQIGFAARLALPVYQPRTFLSPGYQDNLGWGYATALGAQDARRDVPVLSINGDGGFMYTANELATAVRHRIPLVAVVFSDGSFGNVRRIQEENYGNRLIASDLANPDFVKFAESFGAAARARAHAGGTARRAPARLCAARRSDADRDAGRPDAEPVGVHPDGRRCGANSPRSPHLEHQLASEVTRLADPMRFGRLRQIVELDLRLADDAGLVERGDALEMRAVAVRRRPQGVTSVRSGFGACRSGCDEGGTSAGPENRERPRRHVSAHGLEHRIAVAHRPW